MRLVIDASVATEASLADEGLGPLAGHDLLGPALLLSEAVSVIRELAWRGAIPPEHAISSLQRLLALPVRIESPDGHYSLATEVAETLGWAKTYDAEYVALAMASGAPLVTLDDKLRRGAGHLVQILKPDDVRAA
jgi:predicted nucleic acid-binding protein